MASSTNTELATKINSKPANTVGGLLGQVQNGLEKRRERFEAVLPKDYSVDRFLTATYMLVVNNQHLQQCTPASIVAGALEAAQQGLDFAIPNEVYLVPYKGKAQKQNGYKGLLKMARRDPNIKSIDVNVVRENDCFEVSLGTGGGVTHKLPPAMGSRGSAVGFYAIAETTQGGFYTHVMNNEEMWAHAKRFPPKAKYGPFGDVVQKGPDANNWEAYGFKTVCHMLCNKKLDLSTDMGRSIQREFDVEEQRPAVVVEAQAVEEEWDGTIENDAATRYLREVEEGHDDEENS